MAKNDNNGIEWKLERFHMTIKGLEVQLGFLKHELGEAQSYYEDWLEQTEPGKAHEFDEARYAQRVQVIVLAFLANAGLDRIASEANLVTIARALNKQSV